MAAVITLTTDFGTADGFAGAMKGVILSLAPDVSVVDITHDVPPHDIRAGSFALETALPHFPPDAIHVVVVDPGVGSDRAALLVDTGQGRFVAPDNGVLTGVVPETGADRIFTLDRPEYWRPQVSATFHGRDVFAPVAAHLARGARPDALGTPRAAMARLPWPRPRRRGQEIDAEVIHVDRFGNLITNLRLAELGPELQPARLRVGDYTIDGITPHYAAGDGLMAVVNSGGRIEIALPGVSAARRLKVGVGTAIHVTLAAPVAGGD